MTEVVVNRLLPWVIGALLLALLAYFCIQHHQPLIEDDLKARTSAELTSAGASGVEATFAGQGRDLTLRGIVPNEKEKTRLGKIAAGTYGVRVVDNQLQPGDAIRGLAVVDENGKVVLSGAVPDQATRDLWVKTAHDIYGADTVIDQLKVLGWGVTAEPFRDAMVIAIPFLKKLDNGRAEPMHKGINISGQATYYDLPKEMAEAFKSLPADYQVDLGNLVIPPKIKMGRCQDDVNKLLSGDTIGFDTAKATIKAQSMALIDRLANALKICPEAKILIEGHTDSQGNPNKNRALSDRRASAVKAALVAKGVETTNLSTIGYGDTRPIGDNATAAGRKQNRRIEFKMSITKIAPAKVVTPKPVSTSAVAMIDGAGTVTMTGTVADQATKALWLKTAHDLFTQTKVVDRLKVAGAGTTAPAQRDALKMTLPFLNKITSGRAVSSATSLSLSGSATYFELPDEIRTALRALPAEYKVDLLKLVIPAKVVVNRCQDDVNKLLSSENIGFDSARATIKGESLGLIDRLAQALARCPDAKIRIEGHTDSQGNARNNLNLSNRRAEAVKNALVARGVNSANCTTEGFGQTRPIGDNATASGRKQNRRIEFKMEVGQ